MTVRYEELLLLSPELGMDECQEIVGNLSAVIEREGGTVVKVDDWGVKDKNFSVKQPVYIAEINWDELFKLIKRDKVQFKEMPKFPEVRRDLALLLDETVK